MPSEPMLIDKEFKRPQKPGDPESKKKSQKQQRLEALNYDEPDAADEPEVTNIQPPTLKKPIKKDAKNNKQIPPGRIGIQLLRELLEDAKNKQKLSTDDASAYTALYKEYRLAKGDPILKKVKLNGLREIYGRVLYKK